MSPLTPPPVRIALLACVTREDDRATPSSTPYEWAKQSFHRLVNDLRWKSRGEFRYRYWQYQRGSVVNSGDSAIREATRQQLARLFAPRAVEFVEIAWRDANASCAARINQDCQLLIWTAGAVAHLAPEGQLPPRFDRYVEFLRSLKIPAAAFGIGVSSKLGPAPPDGFDLPPASRRRLAAFAGAFDICGVRDEGSFNALRSVCGPAARIDLISDPALFLEAGTSASMAIQATAVGVNFAFHGPHCESLAALNFNAYLDALRRVRQAIPDCEFYYFAHCRPELLLARLLHQAGIDLTIVSGAPHELLAAYRNMRIHIGQMLHSCILAANAGTPAVGLAYDTKHGHFFRSIGMETYCLPPWEWNPAVIASKAAELNERRDEMSARIRRAAGRLMEQQKLFLEPVRDLVRD